MNSPTTGIRASDAEREQVAQLLQTAVAEGRLTPEEAGDRLAQASAARFRDELQRLVTDLPAVPRELPGARPLPRAFWVAGGLLRVAAFIGFMLLFWRVALWPTLLFGVFGFFAMTRAMRYGWHARRQRWMMRRGWPDRWVTVVR
jgi:uncharacterized protein DUF1707